MGDVVDFTGVTKGRIDPGAVVSGADSLEDAVVIGVHKNGDLYVCGSDPDISRTVHLLALAQKYMLELDPDSIFD